MDWIAKQIERNGFARVFVRGTTFKVKLSPRGFYMVEGAGWVEPVTELRQILPAINKRMEVKRG